MVHSRTDLAHIGEANAELQQAWKFMRLISARRDADLVDRAPKAIAGMRVVVTDVGGPLAGGGADEDQAEMILKLVRKFFHRVGPFRQSRGMPNTNSRSPCGEREGQVSAYTNESMADYVGLIRLRALPVPGQQRHSGMVR